MEFRGIRYTDAGKYLCTAVNAAGKTEGVAEVIVDEDSDLNDVSRNEETAYVNANVELKCPLGGPNSYSIVWTKMGEILPDNAREQKNILFIYNVRPDNAGRYICTVMTERGPEARDFVTLEVRGKLKSFSLEFYYLIHCFISDRTIECTRNQFRCRDGTCIDIRLRCNRQYDCSDSSDETDCGICLLFTSIKL